MSIEKNLTIPILRKKLSELNPAPYNPKFQNEVEKAGLTKSLEKFGYVEPIVWNQRTGNIIDGHQRYFILLEKGVEDVEVVAIDVSPEEEKQLNITLGNKHIAGSYIEDKLQSLLKEIQEDDNEIFKLLNMDELKMPDWGFEDDYQGETDEDSIPSIPKVPTTKLGDMYQLGDHILLCGDAVNVEDVEKLMCGNDAKLLFTSPPYNAGEFVIRGSNKFNAPKNNKKYSNNEDNLSEKDYYKFLCNILDTYIGNCETIFLNVGLLEKAKRSVCKLLGEYNESFKDVVYWKKSSSTPHIVEGIMTMNVEPIYGFGKYNSRKFKGANFKGNLSNVVEGANASGNNFSDIHNATFPVYLPE